MTDDAMLRIFAGTIERMQDGVRTHCEKITGQPQYDTTAAEDEVAALRGRAARLERTVRELLWLFDTPACVRAVGTKSGHRDKHIRSVINTAVQLLGKSTPHIRRRPDELGPPSYTELHLWHRFDGNKMVYVCAIDSTAAAEFMSLAKLSRKFSANDIRTSCKCGWDDTMQHITPKAGVWVRMNGVSDARQVVSAYNGVGLYIPPP
jgi:hypothetical protein